MMNRHLSKQEVFILILLHLTVHFHFHKEKKSFNIINRNAVTHRSAP